MVMYNADSQAESCVLAQSRHRRDLIYDSLW